MASLSTVDSWYITSATSWASATSGRSSPHKREDTYCFTLLRAHFLKSTSSSPTGVGVAPSGLPPLDAQPFHATSASGPSPSTSSSDKRPTPPSSSVSKGCSALYQDTIKGEVSRTSLMLFSSAITEKRSSYLTDQASRQQSTKQPVH